MRAGYAVVIYAENEQEAMSIAGSNNGFRSSLDRGVIKQHYEISQLIIKELNIF